MDESAPSSPNVGSDQHGPGLRRGSHTLSNGSVQRQYSRHPILRVATDGHDQHTPSIPDHIDHPRSFCSRTRTLLTLTPLWMGWSPNCHGNTVLRLCWI